VNLNKHPRIRPIAICVISRDDSILVFKGYDDIKKQIFYRPLGGGIEFGELSQDAVRREISEELGAELCNMHFMGMLENIFVYNGENGHELVFVYKADFADRSLYEREVINASEDDFKKFEAIWVPISTFTPQAPIYPDGLLDLIMKRKN
jgi:8-oxo-dGTP pyrophosphatase MutT (NUDIX family)